MVARNILCRLRALPHANELALLVQRQPAANTVACTRTAHSSVMPKPSLASASSGSAASKFKKMLSYVCQAAQ
eukprot:9171-Heterococcus_DN1.PRE.1